MDGLKVIMENPIKMDDLGHQAHGFCCASSYRRASDKVNPGKTPIFGNIHV